MTTEASLMSFELNVGHDELVSCCPVLAQSMLVVRAGRCVVRVLIPRTQQTTPSSPSFELRRSLCLSVRWS